MAEFANGVVYNWHPDAKLPGGAPADYAQLQHKQALASTAARIANATTRDTAARTSPHRCGVS